MATVTPEQMKKALSSLSALEGMASGYCELQDGFDTSKGIAENVRQVLAALAAPPAEVYPNSDKGLREMCPGVSVDVLRGIQEAAFRAGRESMAQVPPASDPPGLAQLATKFIEALREEDRASRYWHEDGSEESASAYYAAMDARLSTFCALVAYPLPASPQAETKGDE